MTRLARFFSHRLPLRRNFLKKAQSGAREEKGKEVGGRKFQPSQARRMDEFNLSDNRYFVS